VLVLAPAQPRAQQVDLDAAAKAKAAAGQEVQSSHAFTSPLGPKAGGTFVAFDAPGAGTGYFEGTFPTSINDAGEITGRYVDANGTAHSFARAKNGTITTFDVPGGTTSSAYSINSEGTVTGQYIYFDDPNSVPHGYSRSRNGAFSTFDAPNAGQSGTFPVWINPAGAVTGTYVDANTIAHGFVRPSIGELITFDLPNADNNPADNNFRDFPVGTQAADISPEGVVLGVYTDVNTNRHGFIRGTDGGFTTFDPPGQINALPVPYSFRPIIFALGTSLYMNPQETIAGTYFQLIPGNPYGGNYRVFVRAQDGSFTTFDAVPYPNGNPSLNIYCCTWSFPTGISPSGEIIGSFNDAYTNNHGFVRTTDGIVMTIDAPGAGKGFIQGTVPMGITAGGVIMGVYIDANNVHHGFVFAPPQ
jgi:hypothetical protein